MPKPSLTALKAIRGRFATDYDKLCSYIAVGALWGVSAGTAWRFAEVEKLPDYRPVSERIISQVLKVAEERGVITKRYEKRMRIEIDPDIDKDILKKIN